MNYIQAAVVMQLLTGFLLLTAANRMAGFPPGTVRCLYGALLTGLHAGGCMAPGLHFLGNPFWLFVATALTVVTAFGVSHSAIRRGLVYVLLRLAMWGLAAGNRNTTGMLLSGAAVVLIACVAFSGNMGAGRFVPVELSRGKVRLNLLALLDTGNTLRDPVTGQRVLIVDPKPAEALTGLSPEALADPVGSMGKVPGLRLIPYRSVGRESGFLLALRIPDVTVNGRKGEAVVAFSPTKLSMDGGYEALAGGIL